MAGLFDRQDDEQRAQWLRAELQRHNDLYYRKAQPEIADDAYDALMAELRALEHNHPELAAPDSPTQRVGSAPEPASSKDPFPPFKHAVPLLSMGNTYSDDEVRLFIRRTCGILRDAGVVAQPRFVAELKIDGFAFTAVYRDGTLDRGATRGDGATGENITRSLRVMDAFPKQLRNASPGEVELRGEIYMPRAAFARMVEEQEEAGDGRVPANPRNAAAGSIKLLDAAVVASRGLECFFYQIIDAPALGLATQTEALARLEHWGLPVNPMRGVFGTADEILAFRDTMDPVRHTLPYDTDGLVIKLDQFAMQEILGLGASSPNWAVAYKFAPERAQTTVQAIRVQVGSKGKLTPVADFAPVRLAGSTITHASLHNQSWIQQQDVRVGDHVLIEKAGEIIPQISSVCTDKRTGAEVPFVMPSACPSCGAEPEQTATTSPDGRTIVLHHCRNPLCPAQRFERLRHFASRDAMDIDGMGPAVIQWLVDNAGLATPSDFYALTAQQLAPMTKAGGKMAQNLLAAVADSKKRGLAKLLFALSIPNIGETVSQMLAKQYHTMDALRAAPEEELAALPMGEPTAYRTLGKKAAAAVYDAVHALPPDELARAAGQDCTVFLLSLAPAGVGPARCKAVGARYGTADALLAASAADIALTEMGVSQMRRTLGAVAARSLTRYFADPDAQALLQRLADAGVVMGDTATGGTRVEGKVFVLTGTLPTLGRAEAKRMIENAGGLAAGTVSRKTDYLVAGADPGSKLDKARQLNITIIDEQTLRDLCS